MTVTWASKVADLTARLGRDADLNELLALARSHEMTPEEIAAQRLSYVRAEVAFGSDASEAAYRRAVETGDSETLKRIDEEAAARLAFYDAYREKQA